MEEVTINWQVKHFNELSVPEYHDLLALRTAVFVVEQDCPYQEIDDKDKVSYHVFGVTNNNECVAVSRILPQNISYQEVSIGRIAVAKNTRGSGVADELMNTSFEFIKNHMGEQNIRISAQQYLLNFYNRHGFKQVSEMYLEDNIPHIEMLKEVNE